jgi:hypothetical protein
MHSGITVYFRKTDYQDEPEFKACVEAFDSWNNDGVTEQRSTIPPGNIVIPRYSMLPFAKELEIDIRNMGSKLINSYQQHRYVAELRNWYYDLEGLTPKTWFRLQDIEGEGPFVLKGSTNSKKFSWNTHMYAPDRKAAGDVYMRLLEDGLTGTQDIVVREFVKLRNYGKMECGIPISHEFRCFFYKDVLLTKAFYWSNEIDDIEDHQVVYDNIPPDFLKKVAGIVAPNINFWVVDVAETEAGEWIVVELNDGCMSGLSMNDPKVLYSRLKEEIDRDNS